MAEISRLAFKERFEDRDIEPEDARSKMVNALTAAFKELADLPTDLSAKPYANLIYEPETHKMEVRRAAIVRDIILKRYDRLKASVEKKLEGRLKSSIGEDAEVEDFLW